MPENIDRWVGGMRMNKREIWKKLKKQLKANQHLIGVAVGSGLTGRYAEKGGADFILALVPENSGKWVSVLLLDICPFLTVMKSSWISG